MMTSLQCLAKAIQLDDLAGSCEFSDDRAAFASLAQSWRGNARLAGDQEDWLAAHPVR